MLYASISTVALWDGSASSDIEAGGSGGYAPHPVGCDSCGHCPIDCVPETSSFTFGDTSHWQLHTYSTSPALGV